MPKNPRALALAGLLLGHFPTEAGAAEMSRGVLRSGAPFVIDVWETDDGLPQSTVTSIAQTQDGYLWLGTLNGLVRFDGLRFTVFDESNTPGLKSSWIVSLFEDRQGRLWIGTETGGVALLRGGEVTGTGIGQYSRDRRLTSACQDDSGAVWLYTADGQLWRYWNERFTSFLFGNERPSFCRDIIAERSGPVWIGTDWRQAALSPRQDSGSLEPRLEQDLSVGKLDLLLAGRKEGYWRLADGRVQKRLGAELVTDWGAYPWGRERVAAACEDRDGNLIVGTWRAGLYWFGTGDEIVRLSTDEGLSNNYILSLLVDSEGSLWVGTDGGGLNRVKRQDFQVIEQTRGWVVQSVCEDDAAGVWIGSNTGGVGYWKDGAWERHLKNLPVRTVFVDGSRRVWAGTWGAGLFWLENGLFRQAPGSGVIDRHVSAILEDREGRVWVGTENGLACWDDRKWKLYTTREGLSANDIRALAEDLDGNLWIGTRAGGLNRLSDGKFAAFRRQDGIPSDAVSSLHVDRDGVMWMGTFGSGLGRMEAGEWTRYTTREGLLGNSIGYILEDARGDLWLGSNRGLMRVSKHDLNAYAEGTAVYIPCRAYGRADGLPTRECTQGSQPGAARSRDGRLWFPTVKGLAFVHPEQLRRNPYPPPVMIEAILVDGRPRSADAMRPAPVGQVVLPASKESLEIQYTSLNLRSPERSRFRYRLVGHESKWTEAGNGRVARYSNLPPGEYRFAVTACNEDGVWNPEPSTLAVTVVPPFWRTWWFRTLSVGALISVIASVVYYLSTQRLQRQLVRVRHEEAMEKERSRIARDIHDQLGASLTQVGFLGELIEGDRDDPEEVEVHAKQISQTARETARALDEIVWAVNPSNDTLDGLVTYACKYSQEYLSVAGLQYRLDVPERLPEVTLAPEVRHNVFLAFKEAVTNIVRHAGASSAWMRLSVEPAGFVVEIEDNGCGLANLDEKRAKSRNGLSNMRRRMRDIGGSFSIEPCKEGGTRVRLTVPLSKRSDS